MTAQIIPFPAKQIEGIQIFCELPTVIRELIQYEDYFIAITDDGSYVNDENGNYYLLKSTI